MEEPEPTSSDGLNPQQTVGIIVGIASVATILVLLVLIGLMACKYFFFKRGRRLMETTDYYADVVRPASFRRGNREHFSMSPLRGGYSAKGNTSDTSDGELHMEPDDSQAAPYLTEEDVRHQKRRTYIGSRQFPRENLVLLTKLGDGEFGPVYRGEAYGITAREKSRIVTVKMLRADNENKRVMFEQEIVLFSNLNHLNVVGVLGVCTDTAPNPECIIFDAGERHVDLLAYIREKGREMEGVTDGNRIVDEFRRLLRNADEVCLGMAYLCSQSIVHKDVALRNCIRCYNGVVKVANFGLGPKLYPKAYYQLHKKSIPLRWLSPEAINENTFTTESDIWAFGVLLWELFSYGKLPFFNLTDEEVMFQISQEFSTLSPPDKCPEDVFLLMSSCWDIDPYSRPIFLALHQNINDLISPHLMEDHGD